MHILEVNDKYSVKVVATEQHSVSYAIQEKDGSDAEVVCKGSIKWDQCSNWDMTPENVMLHFCGVEDVVKFQEALSACYTHAKEYFNFPDWE